jgi:hypothetical protein
VVTAAGLELLPHAAPTAISAANANGRIREVFISAVSTHPRRRGGISQPPKPYNRCAFPQRIASRSSPAMFVNVFSIAAHECGQSLEMCG